MGTICIGILCTNLSLQGIPWTVTLLRSLALLTQEVTQKHAHRAPEQAGESFGLRGSHSDAWGFGTTILHLASGVLPYNGLSLTQMLSAMIRERPPAVPDTLPSWLQQLLKQCFSFNSAARPTAKLLLQVSYFTCSEMEAVANNTSSLLTAPWTHWRHVCTSARKELVTDQVCMVHVVRSEHVFEYESDCIPVLLLLRLQ